MTSEEQREYNRRQSAAYRKRYPERVRAANKASWDKNKHKYLAKKLETAKRRYAAKKEWILSQNEAYRIAHLDEIRQKQREYRLRNLEKRKANNTKWFAAHKDDPDYKLQRSLKGSANYEKNKSLIKQKHKEWRRNNKGYFHAIRAKRRMLEASSAENLEKIKAWVAHVKSKRAAICYYCQTSVSTAAIHFDHIVPLSKGGPHTVENLCVSCASCNLRKQAKSVTAWMRVGQQVLSL